MQTANTRRLWIIAIGLIIGTLLIIGRLVQFQVVESAELTQQAVEFNRIVNNNFTQRGFIYDKNKNVLAAPGRDYQLGASPALLTKKGAEDLATSLAQILQVPRYDIVDKLLQPDSVYVPLSDQFFAGRIPSDSVEAIRELDNRAIVLEPVPRRLYPQGDLLCHTLGFVDFDNLGQSGIEAYYQDQLAGQSFYREASRSPLEPRTSVQTQRGADLVLTIDRTVQRTVEQHLADAIEFYDATGGTIIAMNPKTGAILAAASWPCYEPQEYYNFDEEQLVDPAVSQQYEPGSVMKVVNMAIGLDSGVVDPSSTYTDFGFFEHGGGTVYNALRGTYGKVTMAQVLEFSINTATSWIATLNTPDTFYEYMNRFGFGRTTGVDIGLETPGTMSVPGSPLWSEFNVATNAFGQGIAVTPLQMVSAVSALANGGVQMRPYVVQEQRIGDEVRVHTPEVMSVPISRETANQVTVMAVQSVGKAAMFDYTVAGKSGTAQIPVGGVYHPTDTIHSYVGWLPADDPQLAMIVKLDKVKAVPWGGESAAPTFAKLAEELVVLLGIPPDEIRLQGRQPDVFGN